MWKIIVVVALLAYLGHYAYRIVMIQGYLKTVYKHKPGPCHLIDGVVTGSEDGQMIGDDLAIISSGLKDLTGAYNAKFDHVKGRILLFDFHTLKATPFVFQGNWDPTLFAPHGIYFYKTKDGRSLLYVVNHSKYAYHTVEKFSVDVHKMTLTHLKTIEDENFHGINDLVLFDEDVFYITNFLGTDSHFGHRMELFYLFTKGSVVFYNKGHSQEVISRILMTNGITASKDKKMLYVMCIGEQSVLAYKVHSDYSITWQQTYPVNTIADNLDVDDNGDIWTGAHPLLWELLMFLGNSSLPSSSQVLRLTVKDNLIVDTTEIYVDDGRELSASSFALRHKNAMLVGTVYHKFLYRELKSLHY